MRFTRAALQAAFGLSDDLGTSLTERLFTTPRRYPRPERERAVLRTGRRFEVEVRRRSPRWGGAPARVAAWRWGYGPTALLVHGWEGRGAQLGAFVEPLVAAGMSVVAFDAPGHGDSPGNRLYLTDHADAIADVITATGPVHAAIAHSFGAAALLVAHRRNGVDVTRNVMLAPNAIIAQAVGRFARALGLDDTERATFEAHLGEASGLGLDALRLDRLVSARDAALLVIHDRGDAEVPFAHGEQLASLWPNAQLRSVDGLGHRRILRDAAVIAETVEFARHGMREPASDLVREIDRHFRRDG